MHDFVSWSASDKDALYIYTHEYTLGIYFKFKDVLNLNDNVDFECKDASNLTVTVSI